MTEAMASYDGKGLTIGRRVTRCADCGNASPVDPADLPWLPGDAAEQTTGYYGCAHFARHDDSGSEAWLVEADGFCAWGFEREVAP